MENRLAEYYEEHYAKVVHKGSGGAVQSQFHKAIERPFGAAHNFPTVLELGATDAEHLAFVKHDFDSYIMLDILDRAAGHDAAKAASSAERDVKFIVGDAQTLDSIEDNSVDRLISMCLLHHLPEPDIALRRWRDVVRPGGVLSIFLPCDPGALWRAGRRATTFRLAKKQGLEMPEIKYLNALDHRNHVGSLLSMTQAVFSDDKVKVNWYPLRFLPSWNANLFLTLQIELAK